MRRLAYGMVRTLGLGQVRLERSADYVEQPGMEKYAHWHVFLGIVFVMRVPWILDEVTILHYDNHSTSGDISSFYGVKK